MVYVWGHGVLSISVPNTVKENIPVVHDLKKKSPLPGCHVASSSSQGTAAFGASASIVFLEEAGPLTWVKSSRVSWCLRAQHMNHVPLCQGHQEREHIQREA